jgi:hypothetical protein
MDGVEKATTGNNMSETARERRRGVGTPMAPLAPYLNRFRETDRRDSGGAGSAQESHGLGLDLWERAGLRTALEGSKGLSGPCSSSSLLAHGIALRFKLGEELVRLNSGDLRPGETRDALFRELITDAAIGLLLIRDAQQVINELILQGDIRQAKRFTSFRAKLRDGVTRIAEHIGHDALQQARAAADVMATARDAG